jgi:hypothetical protein
MESENKQRCHTALYNKEEVLARRTGFADSQGYTGTGQESLNLSKDSDERLTGIGNSQPAA